MQERLMASIFYSITKRSYVRNGNIYIIRIESAVKKGSLSSFADAGGDPFARINVFECGGDGM